jgi:hypothetical protein
MLDAIRRKVGSLILTNKSFNLFRAFGVHVTPVHFYSPIPDARGLGKHKWSSAMPGVAMNEAEQAHFMDETVSRYRHECDFPKFAQAPGRYYVRNDYFGLISAVAMHSMVRDAKPRRVIEIGGGNSTLVLANALRWNADEGFAGDLTVVDPYPAKCIQQDVVGLALVIACQVQELDSGLFEDLGPNDILSIDTSHVVTLGGDVTHLFLDVLPRLASKVIIHVHDIFLPDDYPREWLQSRYFWNEQYLLHALLAGGSNFNVVWGQRYAEKSLPAKYAAAFAGMTTMEDNFRSYSFWMRKS